MIKATTFYVTILLLVILTAGCSRTPDPEISENDWPSWRGPQGNGISKDQKLPLEWGPAKNVVWKAAVPGKGYSTPIISGSRLFLSTADDDASLQRLLCYNRDSGALMWNVVIHKGGFMRKSPSNSHASSSPVADGRRVYVPFINDGALWVTALDYDGKIVWQKKAGPFISEHGYASSPVLYRSMVIVASDSLKDAFVAGLDRATGKEIWRTPRKPRTFKGSYGSPVIGRIANRMQLLIVGQGNVTSYDPESGRVLWSAAGPAEATVSSAAFSDELVFATGGDPRLETLALRCNGNGEVKEAQVAWRSNRGVAYVPTPLFYEGNLYVMGDEGIMTCFEATSGRQLWKARLEGSFLTSPVAAAGRIYVTNDTGKTYILKAGPLFEKIAENQMDSGGKASLVFSAGLIYLRTDAELYCIGAPVNSN